MIPILRMRPALRDATWGGSRLDTLFGKGGGTGRRIAESWEVSCVGSHLSRVDGGSADGRTLKDLFEDEPAAFLGAAPGRGREFPLLVKLLDAAEWLSVQVHPDDEAARRLVPPSSGKSEAWVILDAAGDARLLLGLRPGVTRAEVEGAFGRPGIVPLLAEHRPRPGDVFFVPPGTLHAIGPGLTLLEVQEPSDITYRVWDWGRTDRGLHLDEALGVLSIEAAPAPALPEAEFAVPGARGERLLVCPWFTIRRWRISAPFSRRVDSLLVLHVQAGAGRLRGVGGESVEARPGDTLVVPGRIGQVHVDVREPMTILAVSAGSPG